MPSHNELIDFKYSTWAGVALKGGGDLIVSIETIAGDLRNLGTPADRYPFDILNLGIGLSLGASVGAIGVVVFNCPRLGALHGKDVGKGGISLNASLGGRWGDAIKVVNKYKIYLTLAKFIKKTNPDHLVSLASALMDLQKACGLDPKKKAPQFFTFPIPFYGVGLKLGITYTLSGKFMLGTLGGG